MHNAYRLELEGQSFRNKVIAVSDVAVFGVPNAEFGEEVKAVIEAADEADEAQLRAELDAYARAHLAGFKVPRSFDFTDEMPRLPTGKLYKRLLRDQYWQQGV